MAGPLDRAFVEITGELDTRQMRRAAERAGRAVEEDLTRGVQRAEKSMEREGAKIGATVGEAISDSAGEKLAEGFRRNAAGRLVDSRGRFVSVARATGQDTGEALAKGVGDSLKTRLKSEVEDPIRKQFNDLPGIGGDSGRKTGSAFGKGFSNILGPTIELADVRLPVGVFAALGLALASTAASAVQFTAALAPAVGIVATLPSGIGILTAGISTLRVATMGVGDAFSAAFGDAEEFEEAMEGLAPNVQAAAQALRDMAPELDALRDRVQDAFFQDFDNVLIALSETLMGPVSDGMTAVAGAVNGLIQMLTGVATSQEGVDFVTQSFALMAQVVERLQEPLTLLFSSLLNVGTALNEAFGPGVGEGLADLITRFALFLDEAAASGRAVQWVHDAMTVFSALGDIMGAITGIIGSIGAAATETGGNILGAFGAALGAFDAFLASAEGQSTLVAIFEALNTVGDAFSTVLQGIAPAIPPIVSGISNILSVVAPLLGPLSRLVGSVLSALAPILDVVAGALQPIIGPLTEVIELLGPILVDAITTLLPVIEFLADFLGGALGVAIEIVAAVLGALAPIITTVLDALSPLIEALEPLFMLLGVVADLIGSVLEPVLQVLGDILLWLVENIILPILVPALEGLVHLLVFVLGDAIQWIVRQFETAGAGLVVIFEFLEDQFQISVDQMVGAWEFLSAAFNLGWKFLNARVFTPIKMGINLVKTTVSNALDAIKTSWNVFVNFIKGIPGKISGSLRSMFSPLAEGFKSAINSVIRGWNNLSFTVPSVDLGPLGEVGGFTVSTPNIPFLARGGLTTGPTLAMVGEAGTEAVLPLEDRRTETLLAGAIQAALAGMSGDAGLGRPGDSPNVYVTVKIGDRELTDIVDTRIDVSNQRTLRRARAATGRNR